MTILTVFAPGNDTLACTDCGCYVWDEAQHLRWHDDIRGPVVAAETPTPTTQPDGAELADWERELLRQKMSEDRQRELETQLHKIALIHRHKPSINTCSEDGKSWPCPTAQTYWTDPLQGWTHCEDRDNCTWTRLAAGWVRGDGHAASSAELIAHFGPLRQLGYIE